MSVRFVHKFLKHFIKRFPSFRFRRESGHSSTTECKTVSKVVVDIAVKNLNRFKSLDFDPIASVKQIQKVPPPIGTNVSNVSTNICTEWCWTQLVVMIGGVGVLCFIDHR